MITLFFFIALLIVLVIWFFSIPFGPDPLPPVPRKITVPLNPKGTLSADVAYQPADELLVNQLIHRWAIRLTSPVIPLDDQLQRYLKANGAITSVVSVALDRPELPPAEPKKLTPAEHVVEQMTTAEELLVAYCRRKASIDPMLDEHSVGTVDNRSIKKCLEDIADQQIKRIVNPSGVTNPFRT